MADDSTLLTVEINGTDKIPVSVDIFADVITKFGDEVKQILASSFEIIENDDGLATIDIHPAIEDGIPIVFGGTEPDKGAILLPGRYKFTTAGIDMDSGLEIPRGLFLIEDKNNVSLNGLEFRNAAVGRMNENGEIVGEDGAPVGYENAKYWVIANKENNSFVNVNDVFNGLHMLATLKLIIDKGLISADITDKNKPLILPGGRVFPHALRGKPRKKDITKVGSDHVVNDGVLAISAESNKAIEAALSSSKTFMQLNNLAMNSDYKYSHDRVCRVEASVSELLEDRDLDAKDKNNRAKIRREVKSLGDGIRWTFEKTPGKGDFVTIPLAGGAYGVKGDHIVFSFSPDYMALIANRAAGRIPTPKALLTTDEKRNPGSTSMGFKLVMHSYQNIGKKSENTLSVKALLNSVNEIPTYDEVKNSDRHYDRRIIAPMERNLNHLVEIGVINYWEYCHAKGEPLTDEEQDTRENAREIGAPLPYDIAINCNIQWELAEKYPENAAKTLESRERKNIKDEAAKQRNEERQKRIDRKIESNIAKKIAEKEVEKRS